MSETLDNQLEQARQLHSQKALTQAQAIYEQLLAQDTKNAEILHLLGVCHYQQGHTDDAITCLEAAIEHQPGFIDAHYRLAIAYSKKGDDKKTQMLLEATLLLAPKHFPALFQLGNFLMRKGAIEKAIEHYQKAEKIKVDHYELQVNLGHAYFLNHQYLLARDNYHYAIELENNDPAIHFNLGVIAEKEQQENHAINHYINAIKIDENYIAAHFNIALLYLTKAHPAKALKHLKIVRALNDNDESTDYLIKALEKDERLKRAPAKYIEQLFDQYADHYDLHLTKGLAYNIPEKFMELYKNLNRHDNTALDLGCGTGLCAQTFTKYITHIEGLDLSANMLALAKKTGAYQKLYQQDIFDFLTENKKRYDLIIAGDVLVYIGELSALFPLIANALNPSGGMLCNIEKSEQLGYQVDQSGRFKHHSEYIVKQARDAGLSLTKQVQASTRYQQNHPVAGEIFFLEKS